MEDIGKNDIEKSILSNVLKREQVDFDMNEIKRGIINKVVLVTGASGSIGRELCRQIAECSASRLILLGHDETGIYEVYSDIQHEYPDVDIVPVIADIREKDRMRWIIGQYFPDIVIHTAFYKNMELMEQNASEAYINNVTGTQNTAEACCEFKIAKFILISSDKAVNPETVVGYTRKATEDLVRKMDKKGYTRFIITRLGNVMNANGSIIPMFRRQVEERRSVTVDHPDMVRFFMTLPEAVHLTLLAAVKGKGGETFVLDMGEPVKILDIAKDIISSYGLVPDKDIHIEYTGFNRGERLIEQIISTEEEVERTKFNKVLMVKPKKDDERSKDDQGKGEHEAL